MRPIEALPPQMFGPISRAMDEDVKETKKKDQDVLKSFADSDEWNIVKGIIERKIGHWEDATLKAVSRCVSLEELGLRYIVRDQVVASLRNLIKSVEFSKKAKDQRDKLEAKKKADELANK